METDRIQAMSTMNVSLPSELREFAEKRAAIGFGSVSEYMRDLLRDDQKRAAQEKLEQLLVEGLESGEPIAVTKEYFERKLAELTKRHAKKKRHG